MKLNANELIKLLITKEGLTQKELTLLISSNTGKKITPDGFSRKITKGTITFNDMVEIVYILGYELTFNKKE